MNALLAQLSALIGVAVGIVGTIFATTITDRARWNRDQSIRWDGRRLDAYAEYASAVKEIHRITLGLTATRMSANPAQPIDREVGLDMLAQAEAHRTKAWESVLLLGDTATVASGLHWRNAIRPLEAYARELADDDKSAEWLQAIRSIDEERDRFYVAARASLSIPGGSVEQASTLWANIPSLDDRGI